jgi:hypothetical protein
MGIKRFSHHPTTIDEYSDWNRRELDRMRVSRRSLLKGAVGGAGALALLQFPFAKAAFASGGGVSGSSQLVISGRHLSWAADGGSSPSTAMRVTAQLSSPTATLPQGLTAVLEIGSAPGSYGTTIPAQIVHLIGMYAIPGGPIATQYYVKAEATGLSPGTLHHYRVRLSDGTVTGDAYFTTAPSRTTLGMATGPVPVPFTFTAFADVGTNKAPTDPRYAWHQDPTVVTAAGGTWPTGDFDNNYYSSSDPVAGPGGTDLTPALTQSNSMSSQRPVFTLLAGDICYADPGGAGLPANDNANAPAGTDNYDPYVWDVFLNQIEGQAAYTPWMFATGNHDMEALYSDTKLLGNSPTHGYASHAARLDLPKNGPATCPSVYAFVYGNVGVISVDANDLSFEIQTNTGYSDGAQLRWLTNQLEAWRTDAAESPKVDFIVAFFHHCAYSTTSQHASDGGVRQALDPLFTRYQVDLVVQGHNHILERTDPIKNGAPTKKAPDGSTIEPRKDGVTYMCVGSGGRPRYAFQPAPSAAAPPPPGVTPHGSQALPEGQRYRGYKPSGGPNSSENNTETVVNSYVWSEAGTTIGSGGYPEGTKVPEVVDWSQVRYDDYAFIAVDVVPARAGAKTTMTVRTLADSLPGTNALVTEIDRIALQRIAGANGIGSAAAPATAAGRGGTLINK